MGMKFLNKKGWHTGSLRNIENVWKAEQKHEAEQKKLEELRKQIHEEREKSEFRLLQEQAGLIPKQERLDFLYDSGLAVGKKEEGFKSLESLPKPAEPAASSSKQQSIVPGGALFEEKPQSANDAWRKLHSDPLLLIRQREQEAIARVKNNPVQMAMIRKSVEEKKAKKRKEKASEGKHHEKKSSRHKHERHRDAEDRSIKEEEEINKGDYRSSKYEESSVRDNREKRRNSDRDSRYRERSPSDHPSANDKYEENSVRDSREKRRNSDRDSRHRERSPSDRPSANEKYEHNSKRRNPDNSDMDSKYKERSPSDRPSANEKYEHNSKRRNPDNSDRDSKYRERSPLDNSVRDSREKRRNSDKEQSASDQPTTTRAVQPEIPRPQHHNSRNNRPKKLSEEERAARLREMQMDAEIHEELRWKRLKKAEENDAKEISRDNPGGRNFLDAAHKSVFGAEKGGSSTIEESVRRRTHYSQGRSQVSGETNAFRR
jgi:hypothetical protein